MSALTKNIDRVFREDGDLELPVKASQHIYQGSIVCVDATGFVVVGSDTAGLVPQGVAMHEADNSSGSDGDQKVLIQTGKREQFSCSGASQAWVGQDACIVDDNTVALAATTTNDIVIGKIVKFISSTKVEVRMRKQ